MKEPPFHPIGKLCMLQQALHHYPNQSPTQEIAAGEYVYILGWRWSEVTAARPQLIGLQVFKLLLPSGTVIEKAFYKGRINEWFDVGDLSDYQQP